MEKKEKIMRNELVLVTGGSGFVGVHCILQLLDAGYRVRTTVRSLQREAEVRAMLKVGGVAAGDRLTFVAADLLSDAGWAEAVAGCDFVLHVASPFPASAPKQEDELIRPAREGALRVLRAAREAGVKRVVLTSSFVAIGYGKAPTDRPFSEQDWTDLNGRDVTAYGKSKTLAERAAWEFMAREGGDLTLSVINPVGIFGPALGPDISTSLQIIQRIMNGGLPAVPRLVYGCVDVRDVADLHIRAMTHPAANGERFLAVADGQLSFLEISQLLKAHMGKAGEKAPTRVFPDWVLRLGAPFDPSVAQVVHELGKIRVATNEKAKRLLDWRPRANEEAILASARSLVQLGLV
ncbi:MAG: aldehyde reductase [Anaerolineaceae bacterium]|nr:aldehyde reductase [Anaerolineaceae bacterium]